MTTRFMVGLAVLLGTSSCFALEAARDWLPITGRVVSVERYMPEPGVFELGYVKLYLAEEGTRKVFTFMSEDSNCALAANRLKMRLRACPHEAEKPEMLWLCALGLGARVRATQWTNYATGLVPRFFYETR